MAIKVRATAKGFFGGRIIRPGEQFEVATKDDLGAWMERVPAKGKAGTNDNFDDTGGDKNPGEDQV